MTNIQTYYPRRAELELRRAIAENPVTAVIGPRQCGKSTLVCHVLGNRPGVMFLDLQLPSDLRKLDDAELFLREHEQSLVCLDEIQLRPDLFPLLRALVDRDRRPGRFVLLGSASRDLIRQGGETLAGRIHYLHLTPFLMQEVASAATGETAELAQRRLWWRGGFPPAFLARSDAAARRWCVDLIQDYLNRDLPQLGFSLSAAGMYRFWRMLSHYHGGVLNASKLGQALDVSHNTVRRHLELLEQTFMVRVLLPYEANVKKRLVKSPKVYLRDSGLLHALLEVESATELFGHPAFGASWEGFCLEQVVSSMPGWQSHFYRTSSGEELDLVLTRGKRRLVFEFKASSSPHFTKGFPEALATVRPERTWVVCPISGQGYSAPHGVRVTGLPELLADLAAMAE